MTEHPYITSELLNKWSGVQINFPKYLRSKFEEPLYIFNNNTNKFENNPNVEPLYVRMYTFIFQVKYENLQESGQNIFNNIIKDVVFNNPDKSLNYHLENTYNRLRVFLVDRSDNGAGEEKEQE